MQHIIVVNRVKDWPFEIDDVKIVSARQYLTDESFSELRKARVYNLCRSYRYQTVGYYVSLLAMARGHRPKPDVHAIQEMKSQTIIRFISEDLDEIIQRSLEPIKSDKFTLSIYFGKNMVKRYDRLCKQLSEMFSSPLLRAVFVRNGKKWQLQSLGPIGTGDIIESHRDFIAEAASEYFSSKRKPASPKKVQYRYSLAILVNPAEGNGAPSDSKAINQFVKAAERAGIETELIGKEDYSRLAEFDALFIRETTSVNHHTFRFAQRAAAEGLVVIDDPESILKCTNKVFLAELLSKHQIAAPKTLVVHRENTDRVVEELGLPCILKQPDSSFSQGVIKVESEKELIEELDLLMEKSDLVVAQKFMPTEYDWRIGVLDKKPLYACRYYMANEHWQIIKTDNRGEMSFGKSETIPWEQAPKNVIKMAVKTAALIGDGLYGVDIKQNGDKCYLIEVNDNPNLDAGFEDAVLKERLYDTIIASFINRIEAGKRGES
ncbi:MAG: RimK family protein [Balneolia bacterium]|nr:RimK family protein [Balneolia bacterium]